MATAADNLRSLFQSAARLVPANSLVSVYKYAQYAPLLNAVADRILLAIIPAKVQIPEGVILLDPTDPVISGALTFGIYESYEAALFRKILRPGMVVVDIGANIGYYSVIAAAHIGEKGRLYSFEPEPVSRSFLEKNVRENGFKNVQVSELAVSDREGTAKLHISEKNKGNHSIMPLRTRAKQFSHFTEVPTVRLDSFLKNNGIGSVDLIKIDVEGAEWLVLQGMPAALRQPAVTLFVEFFPDTLRDAGADPAELLTRLMSCGFSIFAMNANKRALEPVADPPAFVSAFPRKAYCNLLCTKDANLKFDDR